MPIKPRPFTFVCEDCNWKKTVAPRSDALAAGEWFSACPKCGGTALKMRAAGWLEAAAAELMARIDVESPGRMKTAAAFRHGYMALSADILTGRSRKRRH